MLLIPDLAAGGIFAPLRDPALFSSPQITLGGRALEWTNESRLCADALWMQAHGIDIHAA